jgi:hypothetical protein
VVREHGCTACHLWLTIENQFLSNREQRTLQLDVAFRNFVQGDLSVSEYCRKFKAMADGLADLGSPIEDQILILNFLGGLNQRFDHVGSIIWCYSLFPNFLKVRDDLLLEEIHMDSTCHLATLTALYTNVAPRQQGCRPPRRLTCPVAAIAATVATGTRITTRTAMTVMVVATTVGTTVVVAATVALLARPPSPPPLMAEPAHHDRLMATRGRGT